MLLVIYLSLTKLCCITNQANKENPVLKKFFYRDLIKNSCYYIMSLQIPTGELNTDVIHR